MLAQPHNNRKSIHVDFLDYVSEEMIEQPDKDFNPISSFNAATAASMLFSAVLPMGGSPIACCSQPIPCSISSSNITNRTSVEHTGLADGRMIVGGTMLIGGLGWCQWSDLGFHLCAILFQVLLIYHNSSKCNITDYLLKWVLKWVKSSSRRCIMVPWQTPSYWPSCINIFNNVNDICMVTIVG